MECFRQFCIWGFKRIEIEEEREGTDELFLGKKKLFSGWNAGSNWAGPLSGSISKTGLKIISLDLINFLKNGNEGERRIRNS